MKEYINHSGGAIGADITWENLGKPYGVITRSYSFYKHNNKGSTQIILSPDELEEGWSHILKANKTLYKDNVHRMNEYTKNLLSRNWFQVKYADSIYAIGKLHQRRKKVCGGTGWAVQMAIDNQKPVYVYDQINKFWYTYLYTENKFVEYYDVPILTENFAGIGTRALSQFGKGAIQQIYKHNFNKKS